MTYNKIICDDFLSRSAGLADGSIDMVFADPPFNVGKDYGQKHIDARDDYEAWCAAWIEECFRVLAHTGTFYLKTLPRHLVFLLPLMSQWGIFVDVIIWKITSLHSANRRQVRMYEAILQYGKTPGYKFNKYAERVVRQNIFPAATRKKKPRLTKPYLGRVGNIWNDIKGLAAGALVSRETILRPGTKRKANPCQTPIALVKRAIVFSTDPRDVILDPFCGTGTTAIAALETDRQYICVDISQEYTAIATERVESWHAGVAYPLNNRSAK